VRSRSAAKLLRRHHPQRPAPAGGPGIDGGEVKRGVIRLVAFAAVVIILVTTLPGLGSIRSRLSHGDPAWIAAACGLRLCSALCYVVLFRSVFDPRMPRREAYRLGMAEIGTNAFLPAGGTGGLAVGGWALHRRGMPTQTVIERSAAFFVFTSAFNVVAVAAFGWLGLTGVLGGHLRLVLTLAPAIVASALIMAIVLLTPRSAALATRQARYPHHSAAWWVLELLVTLGTGARGAIGLFRAGNLRAIAAGAGYLLFDIAVLWAAIHAFRSPGAVVALALAYLIGQLAGEIPVPGGIGVVDGGLIGALALYGVPIAAASAGALAYRAISLGVPALFGGFELVALGREVRHEPAAVAAASADPEPTR
jgi:uncharacterized membrane protein YbhN (UPF0104 family)